MLPTVTVKANSDLVYVTFHTLVLLSNVSFPPLPHTVSDKHQFKKAEYLYRFRYDDGTYRGKLESSDVMARGIRIYCRLHGLFDPLLK